MTSDNLLPMLPAPAGGPTIKPISVDRLHLLPDSALKNGIHIVGGPGSGKSRLMGRAIGWQAFVRGKPLVILDPTGGIVANLIDKMARLHQEQRQKLWRRIQYVDAGAADFVVPTPLYYRYRPTETLFEVANRLPAVLKRQDPQLQSAPILGWNALFECAIHAGEIAAALGRQLDFVVDLISHPRLYKDELRRLLAEQPDLAPAVGYFRDLMDPTSASLRDRRTGSFVSKLLPFLADPTLLATFAAPTPGVDWDAVVAQGQMVIIDFQNELDPERRQFKLIWWFRSFIDYVKQRGMAGRGAEIFFLIDEVTQLLGHLDSDGHAVLAEDLEELVAVLGRNYGVNLVVAHQNLTQIDERVRNVLMQMGTQLIGNIANPDDALFLTRQFFHYQPYLVKKHEPVWMGISVPDFQNRIALSFPEVIDHRTVEFTPEEQMLLAMEQFRLPRFQFLLRPATAEGMVADHLSRLTIEHMDAGQFPNDAEVRRVLGYLRQKCGVPLEELLAEIRGRRLTETDARRPQVKADATLAILGKDAAQDEHTTEAQPAPPTPAGDLPAENSTAPTEQGENDDDFWR